MKAKLLKKLRKEIISNADIKYISSWRAYLVTYLDGIKYTGEIRSTLAFQIDAIGVGKQLEHEALKGYIKLHKK